MLYGPISIPELLDAYNNLVADDQAVAYMHQLRAAVAELAAADEESDQ